VNDRNLDWDGCFNARDLGGLRAADGRAIRWGALVRSDMLNHLTAEGWSALYAHGIRTIVDLRNDDEIAKDTNPRPAGIATVHVPLDDSADAEFWQYCWDNELDGSPLYYQLFLDRKPARCAAAVAAVARAGPGGVRIHCGAGRDRSGLVSMLLLALVGVAPDDIISDYELSTARLAPAWSAWGYDDQGAIIADILKRKHTTARALLVDLLAAFDAGAYLRAAGLSDDDLAAVRARLLG
jgi:protein tyrosine/serine phosphatase